MNKVNDKIGNVRLFKKHLRKLGLIGNRQQFSEEHVTLFKEIREYKISHHTTWDKAFKVGLKNIPNEKNIHVLSNSFIADPSENNIEYTLNEILKTLQRIESKLNN
ncbi:TPA: hypothetical protein ACGXGV_000364 [Bacillus paranthracis]|uniref:hypothetical protein n=1 Tax=Bacillus sp. ME5 TaxID=2744251 RepID=UPI00065B9294|nr:hypothetical protein [Bacillus sp. ME5]KMP45854.1 hypothetical protein TU55_09030 [Bacillus cereus]